MGRQAKATLGFLPRGAYEAAIANGTLILASAGDVVVGYALFALARRRIKLTHLCVASGARHRGVARRLVEWISNRHADYPGILVRCRHDYGLGPMWISLGFRQESESVGRSREGHKIVNWWHDHGHPTLFSRHDDAVVLRAAVDLNILRDFVATGPRAEESRALTSDQIIDQLELVRTPALDAEIDTIEGGLRTKLIDEAARLTSLRGDAASVTDVRATLAAAARDIDPGWVSKPSSRFDLEHLAHTIGAGLTVMVTRDESLARTMGAFVHARFGLRLMPPPDVVVHIDELTHAEAYRPSELLATGLVSQPLRAGQDERVVDTLISRAAHERPRQLLTLLRRLGANGIQRFAVYRGGDTLLAAYATVPEHPVLDVPLFRVAEVTLSETIARQLLFFVRHKARELGTPLIKLSDPRLSEPLRAAALSDGFRPGLGGLWAFAIDVCGTAAEVEAAAMTAALAAKVEPPSSLRPVLPALVAAETERAWWPAKVIDSELPTFVVPIHQGFSTQLLGVPTGVWPREPGLGVSREHVYYRSAAGARPSAPARLLWYITSEGKAATYPPGIAASSHLESVVEGTPQELHTRYRHLGVWELSQVEGAAKNGRVQALRFTNTELLPHAIPLVRVRAVTSVPRSPLRITSSVFAQLYNEGRGR